MSPAKMAEPIKMLVQILILKRKGTILRAKSGQTRMRAVVDILKATQQQTEPCTWGLLDESTFAQPGGYD